MTYSLLFQSSIHPAAWAAVGGAAAAALTPSLNPAGGTLEVVGVWLVFVVSFLAGVAVGVGLTAAVDDKLAVAIAGDALAAADVDGLSAAAFG